jgi:hypothetical protein
MQNWFVGNLFFIGGAMLLMRGFSHLENWLLNVAGIMAPCVALFPMNSWERTTQTVGMVVAAVTVIGGLIRQQRTPWTLRSLKIQFPGLELQLIDLRLTASN